MTPILSRFGKIPWGAIPFALLGIAGVVLATPASAVPITTTASSTFNQSNLFPSSTPQDWGMLNISCDGTTCSVSLTVDNADAFFDNQFLDVNLAAGATNFTLSSAVLNDCVGSTCGSFSTGQNVDGFGVFQYSVDLPDGPNKGMPAFLPNGTTIFTVDYTGAANTLLVNNGGGWDAAGHFLTTGNGNTCTGFAGESVGGTSTMEGSSPCAGGPPPVPEPATLTLIGVGLVVVSLAMRRRREA